ncbi:MAG: hypothetical protein VX784_05910 [Pseudomonadota bacterium]|nr:hypothetical protein [Pseudomonadota bacterium]
MKFEKEIAPSLLETEEKWVEIVSELEGADLQQTWVSDGAFFFCHRQAESEQHVLDKLAANDLDTFFHTAVYEMETFMSRYRQK